MVVSTEANSQIAQSFGFQWRLRSKKFFEGPTLYGLSDQEERGIFFDSLGIVPETLVGKRVLDAGCGHGFLTRILGEYAGEVVGMDLSASTEIAYQNCKHLSNITIVQGDILSPPFRPASFDYCTKEFWSALQTQAWRFRS